MAVAERVGGEILSVDSMQVYRGMDVGTAKPTAGRAGGRPAPPDRRGDAGPDRSPSPGSSSEADAVIADAAPAGRAADRHRRDAALLQGAVRGAVRGPGGRRGGPRPAAGAAERSAARPAERGRPAGGRPDPRERPQAARAGPGGVRADRPADLVVPDALDEPAAAARRRPGSGWTGTRRRSTAGSTPGRRRCWPTGGWRKCGRCWPRTPTLSKTAAEATGYRELIDHVRGPAVAGRRGRADQDRHPPTRPAADEVVPAVPRRPLGGGGCAAGGNVKQVLAAR